MAAAALAGAVWMAGCAEPELRLGKRSGVEEATSGVRPAGTSVAPGAGPTIRVLLNRSVRGLHLHSKGGLRLRGAAGIVLADLPRSTARLSCRGGQLAWNGRSLGVAEAEVGPLKRGDEVYVGGRRYRGRLILADRGGNLVLINKVGLEDYLRGVLPSEVATSGPSEALKAQAVAARSFALWQMKDSGSRPWDLDNSSDSQVYGGRDGETGATDAAVAATRGQVLAWRGQVAQAFFHSNSGGRTADSREVWGGGEAPRYLMGVFDTWSEGGKHYHWSTTVPRSTVEAALSKAGLWSGPLAAIQGRGLSDSSRWTWIELSAPDGRAVRISANVFRRVVGADRLRSTRFRVRLSGENFVFDGLGWGHGVGMSQEGAFAQAKEGRGYRAILDFYYPGAELARLKE